MNMLACNKWEEYIDGKPGRKYFNLMGVLLLERSWWTTRRRNRENYFIVSSE